MQVVDYAEMQNLNKNIYQHRIMLNDLFKPHIVVLNGLYNTTMKKQNILTPILL